MWKRIPLLGCIFFAISNFSERQIRNGAWTRLLDIQVQHESNYMIYVFQYHALLHLNP